MEKITTKVHEASKDLSFMFKTAYEKDPEFGYKIIGGVLTAMIVATAKTDIDESLSMIEGIYKDVKENIARLDGIMNK